MKLMFASDIHGSLSGCERVIGAFERERPEKLVLVGDILYHGPRNPLPERYSPAEVAAALNSMKDKIICVRGNCEAEVDQMMLSFPCLADYSVLWADGTEIFVTHGHLWEPESIPNAAKGSVVVSGHTHIWKAYTKNGISYINTGSASLPKEGNPPTYALYRDGEFSVKCFDGKALGTLHLK